MLALLTEQHKFPLGTGAAWDWFFKNVVPREECIISDYTAPDIKGASHIALVGLKAFQRWTEFSSLQSHRGQPLLVFGLPTIATFHPQDAHDFSREDEEASGNEKDFQTTLPINYRFWIKADIKKLLNGFKPIEPLRYITYPPMGDVIKKLNNAKNQTIYLDIENRILDLTLNCIGIAIDDSSVAVIPIYRYDNRLAYSQLELARFFRALSLAFQRNRVVIHNCFHDLIVLAHKYRILFGHDIFDTMLAHHRCFAEVERSLGHCISYWTWQPFHKDQAICPLNQEQEQLYWKYNALDVHGMRIVYREQCKYIQQDKGLADSVNQVMSSIYPYLLMCLQGMEINELQLSEARWAIMRKQKQYLRIARILLGDPLFNPGSPQQLSKFFHSKLHYEVQLRTATGAPSLNHVALLKLHLQYNNPLIPLILSFRSATKTLAMLEFIPWKL